MRTLPRKAADCSEQKCRQMKKTGILFSLLLLALSTLFGAEAQTPPAVPTDSLKLEFGFENVPDEKHFIAEIVRDRIAARSPSGSHRIDYKIDSRLEKEEFTIESRNAKTTITAGSFPGILFGSGNFLRSIEYRADGFIVPERSLRDKPDSPFREVYFARHFHNWYHLAEEQEMSRYIEDLALQGFNAFCTLDLPVINLTNNPESGDWKELEKGFRVFCRCVNRLGLQIDSLGVTNQGWRDTPHGLYAVPNVDPRQGNNGVNVCPARPEGEKYLEDILRTVNKTFADCNIGVTCFWPYDEGGCSCEKCRPWGGNGFLKLADSFSKIIRTEFDPDRAFIISTWCFSDNEFEMLWKWLEDHPEFEYVLADSHNDFPRYPLEHPLPEGHKLITFPEISMWNRFPWGGYGATPLPQHFTALWRQVKGHVYGCKLYSEGLFEDINKIIVERFYWDNDAKAEETMREYARYELCGANPDDFTALCHLLEALHIMKWPVPSDYRHASMRVMELAQKIDSDLLPSVKNSFRWRLFYCRAVLEYERNVNNSQSSETCVAAIKELQKMYHCDRVPENINDPMHQCVRPVVKELPPVEK